MSISVPHLYPTLMQDVNTQEAVGGGGSRRGGYVDSELSLQFHVDLQLCQKKPIKLKTNKVFQAGELETPKAVPVRQRIWSREEQDQRQTRECGNHERNSIFLIANEE